MSVRARRRSAAQFAGHLAQHRHWPRRVGDAAVARRLAQSAITDVRWLLLHPRGTPQRPAADHLTAPPMFCVRLCAVDDGRSAFPPLSGVSGEEAQNIIDRLPSMLACSLVRDAAGTQQRGTSRSNACRREVIPLRGWGFGPIASDRGDCLPVASWGGYQRQDRQRSLLIRCRLCATLRPAMWR